MTSGPTEIRRSISLAAIASTDEHQRKESGDGKDRDERPAERLARWSGPGPRRRGGLQAGRLVRASSGARTSQQWNQVALDGGAGRRGMAAGPAKLRVLRRALATPQRRACGQAEQHAQVRRVIHARGSRVEQLDRPQGRRGERGLEAQAGAGRRDRRPRQLSARAHADRARPRRRAAAGRLPGRARGRRAPLRRDPRPEAHAPRRDPDHRWRPRATSPTSSSGRADEGDGFLQRPFRRARAAAWRRPGSRRRPRAPP